MSTLTVVTFGDSTTAERTGAVVYTTLLQRETDPGLRWINRGVPGNTTAMARERFERDVVAEAPDIVVIQFGINDAAVDVWKSPPVLEPRVPLARYEENLRYFLHSLKATQARPIVMTPNPQRWTAPLLERYGRAPYCPQEETGFTRILETYAEAARRIAGEEGVPLVDIYERHALWERENGRPCSELLSDGMHPNSEGHRLVADALGPVIRNVQGETG
ncbi:MAG TPA: GDSL-type esterase/lipase family protein [Chthoniobacteraceae bacterium]|nr:GDSL-type esterase/lipase family protein [Chthoniobacteraceae bacterium]